MADAVADVQPSQATGMPAPASVQIVFRIFANKTVALEFTFAGTGLGVGPYTLLATPVGPLIY